MSLTRFPLTCGFSIKTCLRFSTLLGFIISSLLILMGTIFLTKSKRGGDEDEKEIRNIRVYDQYMIYYNKNDVVLFFLALALVIINVLQSFSDLLLFIETFQTAQPDNEVGKRFFLRFLFFWDGILWILNLLDFIIIFSGSGLFLLIIFLLGTSVRIYVLALIHNLISEMRKPVDIPILKVPMKL